MATMPRPRPPHLQRRVSRHGKVTWYVRVGRGPLIRVPDYGDPKFDEAYQAALRGQRLAVKPGSPVKDTVGWLINLYLNSKAWDEGLSKTTKERRLPQLKQVIKSAGHKPLYTVDRQVILAGRDARSAPSQARTFVMTMRTLFGWAEEQKILADNPTVGIKVPNVKTDGHTPWTEEDLVKYEKRWPRGTAERVMLDVYAYTGLRRGDAARVGKQHVKNGVISIKTEKSSIDVVIPILEPLKLTLAAGPTGDMSFNAGRYGLPLTSRGLGKKFLAACRAAGIRGKTAHGLRKAAATRAAENGATDAELDAIFGWTDGQTSKIYTKKANRAKIAKQAMAKVGRTG